MLPAVSAPGEMHIASMLAQMIVASAAIDQSTSTTDIGPTHSCRRADLTWPNVGSETGRLTAGAPRCQPQPDPVLYDTMLCYTII